MICLTPGLPSSVAEACRLQGRVDGGLALHYLLPPRQSSGQPEPGGHMAKRRNVIDELHCF
jgi:hypothetical protein